jgi:hypothetical protein
VPAATSSARRRLVAAMMRTSTVWTMRPPTRWISPVSSARSSLTCVSSGSSPTSSRNRVEPSASSKRPIWRSKAPVKAPFSWPNSTDSTRFSGIAPQLTVIIGFLPRGEAVWIAWAITSLPVPLSPSIRTETRARAALAAIARAERNSGAGADDLVEASGLVIFSDSGRSSPLALAAVGGGVERGEQPVGRERLHQEIVGAGAHRLDRDGDRGLRGQDQQRQIGPQRADLLDQRCPPRPGSQWSSRIASTSAALRPRQDLGCAASTSGAPITHQPARAPIALTSGAGRVRRRSAAGNVWVRPHGFPLEVKRRLLDGNRVKFGLIAPFALWGRRRHLIRARPAFTDVQQRIRWQPKARSRTEIKAHVKELCALHLDDEVGDDPQLHHGMIVV